jgi:hypothetical protein
MGPTCQALLLCHQITTGPLGATSLIDLMATVRFPEFPATCNHAVYVNLTGGKGKETLRFEVAAPDDDVLFEQNLVMAFDDPADDYFVDAKLTPTFKLPGKHFYRLWYGNDLLAQRFLNVDYSATDPRAIWKKL